MGPEASKITWVDTDVICLEPLSETRFSREWVLLGSKLRLRQLRWFELELCIPSGRPRLCMGRSPWPSIVELGFFFSAVCRRQSLRDENKITRENERQTGRALFLSRHGKREVS